MSTLNVENIQHPSSSTPAISLDSNGAMTGSLPYSNRNLIYNGAMQVAQRGTSATGITTTGYYTADRWALAVNGLGTWTQSVENDAPTGSGFRKSLKILCTTADASPAATDLALVHQVWEGQDLQRIAKGTSDAKQLTLSFWVKSNVTGTYIARFSDDDNVRTISAAYTINASGTWEYKTITYDGDTSGVLDNDNSNSFRIQFWLDAGSNYNSGTLATSWESTVNANLAVGQTNLAANTNNYWQITGVQLETGPVATEFEFEPYPTTLAKCQRYYQKSYNNSDAPGSATANGFVGGGDIFTSSIVTTCRRYVTLPVTMRTTPTIVLYDSAGNSGKVNLPDTVNNVTGISLHASDNSFGVEANPSSAANQSRMYFHYTANAEL